jgi:hypothetical protein
MIYFADALLLALLVSILACIAREIYDKITDAMQGFMWG